MPNERPRSDIPLSLQALATAPSLQGLSRATTTTGSSISCDRVPEGCTTARRRDTRPSTTTITRRYDELDRSSPLPVHYEGFTLQLPLGEGLRGRRREPSLPP
jgi:hypothetical protein